MQQPPPPTQKSQRPRDRSEGQGSSQGSSRSAWDRDAKERAEEEEQEELYRAREAEITTLSQRTALNPQVGGVVVILQFWGDFKERKSNKIVRKKVAF